MATKAWPLHCVTSTNKLLYKPHVCIEEVKEGHLKDHLEARCALAIVEVARVEPSMLECGVDNGILVPRSSYTGEKPSRLSKSDFSSSSNASDRTPERCLRFAQNVRVQA